MCTFNLQRFRLLPEGSNIYDIFLTFYCFLTNRHFEGNGVSTPIPGFMCTLDSQRFRLLPQKSHIHHIELGFYSFSTNQHFVGSDISTPLPGLMYIFNSQHLGLLPQKSNVVVCCYLLLIELNPRAQNVVLYHKSHVKAIQVRWGQPNTRVHIDTIEAPFGATIRSVAN